MIWEHSRFVTFSLSLKIKGFTKKKEKKIFFFVILRKYVRTETLATFQKIVKNKLKGKRKKKIAETIASFHPGPKFIWY